MTISEFLILLISTTIFGGIIGAYFGTVEYRIRTHEPLITVNCFCPNCKHSLSLFFQIPVISWIFLKGKCHYCQEPISARYPLIESGFILFYLISFLFLYHYPVLLTGCWILFVAVILFLRCEKHFHSALKAFLIFLLYHICYGSLLTIIMSALQY